MKYEVILSKDALFDIQEAIDWYNSQQKGLGKRYYTSVQSKIEVLTKSPFFAVRYDNVRCLALDKFPYLIHYEVDEANKTIGIFAILNTYRNPAIWYERKQKE